MRRSEICESPNVALLPTTIGDSIVVWYTAQQRSISKEFSFNLSLSNVFKFHVDIDLQSNDAWPTTHEWMKCKRKPPNWTITFFSGDDDANADESDPDWRCRGRDAAELMVAPVMLLLRWKNTFTFLSLALVLCPCSWLCSVFFFFFFRIEMRALASTIAIVSALITKKILKPSRPFCFYFFSPLRSPFQMSS